MLIDNEKYKQLFNAVLLSSEALISDKVAEEVMNEVIAVLGKAANVDRVYIFKNSFENGELAFMHYKYEWVKDGIEAQLGLALLAAIPWSEFDWLKDHLLSGASYAVSTNELEEGGFKEALEIQDIKSILFTPIIFDNKFWGYIGFDDCTQYRNWLDIEVSTLLAISANIGSYLKRIELTEALSMQYSSSVKQKEFYEAIFNNIPADIVAFNNQHKYLFLNKHSVKSKEVRDWMIGKDDFAYCEWRKKPTNIAVERRYQFNEMLATKMPHQFEEKMLTEAGDYRYHMRVMHPVVNEQEEVEMVIGYGLDITTIKNQEELIIKQNEAIVNSPDGIALLDNKGVYYYMNPAHESIFEYGKDGLIGKSWQILYKPEDVEYLVKQVFPILNENGIWNGQVQAQTKNGRPVFQDLTLRQLEDGSLVCITRDVSDLVLNIRLLEEANQKLGLAIQTTQLGFYEWDMLKDELESNEIFNEILGFDNVEKHTHVINDWFSSIHPDDLYLVSEALAKQRKVSDEIEVENFSIEYRIKGSKGEYIWVLDIGKVTNFDTNGMPLTLVGFIVDISSNKSIEEKIRISEKRYRDLVENLREVIFETDGNANFVFLNPAWQKLTGYSIEESLGKSFIDFYYPDVTLIEQSFSMFDLLNPSQTYSHIEVPLQHKNKELIWFDIEINKFIDESNGLLKASVGSIEDITKRKLAENELKQALAKEKQLGDLKARFVGMASHEFRTPLAGIRSSAELIQLLINKNANELSPNIVNNVFDKIDKIKFDVDRITGLMTDVLTMGSIDSEKITFQAQLADLVAFTQNYLNVEGVRYLLGHDLRFNAEIGAAPIQFDSKLIVHVYNNLMSNAAKYAAPNTAIEVSIAQKKNHVQVIFRDHGIGIPSSELPFIFDTFFRSSNVENIPGTGLGLSIAKYFMDLHKGEIQLESEVNEGTKVILSFPLIKT
jgi:PAS domain S-box-containing protein